MTKVDSSLTCIECLDEIEYKARIDLYKTNKLFHYSSNECIDKIIETRTIWLTPFEKQKTEMSFAPVNKGIYYMASFASSHIDSQILIKNRFKGKKSGNTEMVIETKDLFNLIDKDAGCILVTKKNKKFKVQFVGPHYITNMDDCSSEYMSKIFVRCSFVKVNYVQDKNNITNLFLENGLCLSITDSVGKKVISKFDYQDEIKMVLELLSSTKIEIEDLARCELKFCKDVKLMKSIK